MKKFMVPVVLCVLAFGVILCPAYGKLMLLGIK